MSSLPASAQLLSALRDRLGLPGAKPGCGEGSCGACTVLLDGQPARSCQLTVGSVAGQAVTTIEGLSGQDGLHPVQRAFADEDAAQCGYCTPGFILSAVALLAAIPAPDDAEVNAALADHICRCGGYQRIRRAVHRAAAHATTPNSDNRASENPNAEELPGDRAEAGPWAGLATADRWQAQDPPGALYRPERPWDLTAAADRDWFTVLGDGIVVVLEPPEGGQRGWTTARGVWLHVSQNGTVTAFTGKVDVGQDNSTALRLIVAEELEVPLASVRLVMGDTDVCPFDAGTFGSRSMPDAGAALRRAAAYARGLLPVGVGERRIEIVTGEPVLSDPARWQQAGHQPRARWALDAVTGARQFVSDLVLPGMLHGALLRPAVPGAALRSLDGAVIADWPTATLIRANGLTGVVAADLATARNAIAALAAHAEWDVPASPSSDDLADYLRSHPSRQAESRPFLQQEGSAATALEVAAVRREATFTSAYIAPAALETRVAVARWDTVLAREDDPPGQPRERVTVWTGTQTPFSVRAQVAAALAVGEQDVRVIVPPTGGAFGGKHSAGIAIEAAVLSRHAGKPVRVAWSRHEEFTAGTLRKASVIDVVAGATSDGQLAGWTFVNVNSGPAGITTPYRVADQRLEHKPAQSPLLQGSYRGLAATANNFARESMIDELACELGIDLVKFRLENLADERLAAVLRAVAKHVGWADRNAAEPRADGSAVGWGIACGLEKEGRVATAVQVAVWPDRRAGRVGRAGRAGRAEILRLVSGYECGAIVNPAAVRRQVEGAAVMALGGALFEEIEFRDGVITNAAFSRYRVPRIGDIPLIEVILLDRPDLPPAGAGETPMIAVAPAIAGAIFDATGRRLRSLPLAF